MKEGTEREADQKERQGRMRRKPCDESSRV